MRKHGVNAENIVTSTLQRRRREALTQHEIVSDTGLDSSTVSRALQRLHQKGVVLRQAASNPRNPAILQWVYRLVTISSPNEPGPQVYDKFFSPQERSLELAYQASLRIAFLVEVREEVFKQGVAPETYTIAKTDRALVDKLAEHYEREVQSRIGGVTRDSIRKAINTLMKKGMFKTQQLVVLSPTNQLKTKQEAMLRELKEAVKRADYEALYPDQKRSLH
ncbi:MAG: helix-turn-helix domain-containing protein [Candidatus Bathyarchaeia archaeon]|jgi:predicted transcriptional regulator